MLKKKLAYAFDRMEDFVLVAMFSLMVAVIFYQVIMRYVFNNSSSWSEELGKFLFVWITWLGLSIGARRGEHLTITMITDRLPFKAAHVTSILSNTIVIAICVVTAWYAYTLVISQNSTHYAGIKISMSWGYLAVLIGCILMIIRCIFTFCVSFRAVVNEQESVVGRGGGE